MAEKFESFLSPKAVAKYPNLIVAKKYNQKENKSLPDPTGDFTVSLVVNPDDLQKGFIEKIEQLAEKMHVETVAAGKLKGIKPELIECMLPYKYLDDGTIELKFKQNGQYTNKQNEVIANKILFFDALKQPMFPTDVWGGSVIRVNAAIVPYGVLALKKAGVSFFINAVQVIKLVAGRDADSFGFEEDEEVKNETEKMFDELVGEEVIPF